MIKAKCRCTLDPSKKYSCFIDIFKLYIDNTQSTSDENLDKNLDKEEVYNFEIDEGSEFNNFGPNWAKIPDGGRELEEKYPNVGYGYNLELYSWVYDYFLGSDYRYIFALNLKDKLIGFAIVSHHIKSFYDNVFFWLQYIEVEPSYWNRGFGSSLLRCIKETINDPIGLKPLKGTKSFYLNNGAQYINKNIMII